MDGPTLLKASSKMILESDEGIRLLGYYAPQPEGRQAKATVLLLHGWLGSANSNYIIALGEYLFNRGYGVFRLNLRDHGGTYGLNPGPFRSDRLDEVFNATEQIARLNNTVPLHIVGASLGGNFALRLAWRSQSAISNLGTTIAICPALDPHKITLALDNSRLYLGYFRHKWRKSFQVKQVTFPDLYDFSEEMAASSCMEMTEVYVRNHSPYPDAAGYFRNYTVTPEMMSAVSSPIVMLTAADDPIIPIVDFEVFRGLSPRVQVSIQPHGGHVGFFDIFPFRFWTNEAIGMILNGGGSP